MYQALNQTGPVEGISKALGPLADVFGDFLQRKRESSALEGLGYNVPTAISNPKLRESLLATQQKANLSPQDFAKDQEKMDTLSKFLGPNVAELYGSLTEGGKTQLANLAIQSLAEQRPFEEVLKGKLKSNPEEVSDLINEISNEAQQPTQRAANPYADLPVSTQEELKKKSVVEQEKYLGELREKYQRAQSFKPIFSELRQTIESGGASSLSGGNLADIGNRIGGFTGTTLNAIGKALESGDTGRFRALSKRLLDEMKDIFGGQIRVKELEVFLSMLPEIGKSKKANLSAIDVLERLSEASSMFYETAQDIIEENGGKIPGNLNDQVQKRLKPIMERISNEIKQTTKGFSPGSSGKTLSKEEAAKILQEAQGDKKLARDIAKQRGYRL
jgi:hypothetical protein